MIIQFRTSILSFLHLNLFNYRFLVLSIYRLQNKKLKYFFKNLTSGNYIIHQSFKQWQKDNLLIFKDDY
jgi:hypothetical protein